MIGTEEMGTVFEAIRCTLPSCRCDCFQPGKVHVRTCETCKHGWVAHALDKLGFRSIYQMGLQVEVVQPSVVFDIASLMLYGSQATPIRLKILLDRLFSVLQHEEVLQVLHGFGWAYEDYARGYILQDSGGHVLDKWNLCTREEEQVILQQFLRFGETKAIAQEIILQDARESHSRHLLSAATSESEIKKFLERSNTAPTTEANSSTSPSTTAATNALRAMEMRYPIRPFPGFGIMPSSSKLFGGAAGATSGSGFTVPGTTKESPVKAHSSVAPSGPGSPLSKLQTMQPFDFRSRDRGASPTFSPSATSERSVPTTPAGSTSPQNLSMSSAGSMVSPPMSNSLPRSNKESPAKVEPSPAKSMDMPSYTKDYGLPLDFSVKENADINSSRPINMNMPPRTSMPYDDHRSRSLKKNVPTIQRRNYSPTPGYGGTLVSPSGKKRVLCTACNKTFCDKGALKIHYSAVHLKEMHKCSVDGCNMMFSSRRSRNRHSANPNPKLHMPQNRRKLPDGAVVLDEKDSLQHLPTSLPALMQPSAPIAMTSGALGSSPMDIKPIAVMPIHFADMNNYAAMKHHMSFGDRSDMPMLAKYPRLDSLNEQGYSAANSPQPREEEGVQTAKLEQQHTSQRSSSKRKSVMPTRCAQVEDVYVMSDDNSLDGMSMGETISEGEDPMLGSLRSQSSPERLSQEEDESRCSSLDHIENREKSQPFLSASSSQNSPRQVMDAQQASQEDNDNEEDIEVSDAMYNEKDKSFPIRNHQLKPIGLDGVYEEALDMSTSKPTSSEKGEVSFENGIDNEADDGDEDAEDQDHKDDEEDDYQDEEGMILDIPVDKDDPKKCPACGKIFQNHFTVRTHYQNVHLKLMHTCTVEGCNAAFPSKRSRDRHSSNLNLHRKLLSTSSVADGKIGHKNSMDQSLRDEFLARIYDPQHLSAAYASALHPEYAALLAGGKGLQSEVMRMANGTVEDKDDTEMKSDGEENDDTGEMDELKDNLRNNKDSRESEVRNGAVQQLVNNNTHYNSHTPGCEESLAISHKNGGRVDMEKSIEEEEQGTGYDVRTAGQNGELDLSFEQYGNDEGPVEDPEGDADCHVCGMRFKDNLVLKEHFEKVHPKEMYHCTIQGCDKIFSTRKSRNRHSQNDNLHRHLPVSAAGLV